MKLAQYLADNRLSVKDFAEKLDISPEAVRLYVIGKRRPRIELLTKISHATRGQVTAIDFYGAIEADDPVDLPANGTTGP